MGTYHKEALKRDRVGWETKLRLARRLRAVLITFIAIFAALSLVGVGLAIFVGGIDAVGGGLALAFLTLLVTAGLAAALVVGVLPDLEEAQGRVEGIDEELLEIALKDLGL